MIVSKLLLPEVKIHMNTKIKEAVAKPPRRTKIKYRILRLAILSVVVCVSALMIVMSISITSAYNSSYAS